MPLVTSFDAYHNTKLAPRYTHNNHVLCHYACSNGRPHGRILARMRARANVNKPCPMCCAQRLHTKALQSTLARAREDAMCARMPFAHTAACIDVCRKRARRAYKFTSRDAEALAARACLRWRICARVRTHIRLRFPRHALSTSSVPVRSTYTCPARVATRVRASRDARKPHLKTTARIFNVSLDHCSKGALVVPIAKRQSETQMLPKQLQHTRHRSTCLASDNPKTKHGHTSK